MSQFIKPQIKWTPDKIQLLMDEYPSGDKNKLCDILGIERKTLKCAAKRFGVKCKLRPNGRTPREFRAKQLLCDELESYYWHGFIMADGHISKSGTIAITLAERDTSHLIKFKDFLKIDQKITHKTTKTIYSNDTRSSSIIVSDIDTCEKFKELYSVGSTKTTQPPDMSSLNTKDKFIAFFIGFFDGDGCFDIRKDYGAVCMKIECHPNWHQTLGIISNKLKEFFDIQSSLKFTNRGYSCFRIYKYNNFIKFKNFILMHSIPALKRKWDYIDIDKHFKKST